MRFLRILERAIPLGQVVESGVLIEKMFYHVKAERAIRFELFLGKNWSPVVSCGDAGFRFL